MKIGPQDKPIAPELNSGVARSEGKPGQEARASLARAAGVASALAAATGGTAVSLSAAASTALSAGPAGDVDMDKVRRMQAAVAQGSYRVNPEAIADELIASAESFLPRRS